MDIGRQRLVKNVLAIGFLLLSLVAWLNPPLLFMSENQKRDKAQQECIILAREFNRIAGFPFDRGDPWSGGYNQLLGKITSVFEKTNVSTNDPWGHPYQLDGYYGDIVCVGPDGLWNSVNINAPENRDNILVSFRGGLALVHATINVNPFHEQDPIKARDVLRLVFNKRVRLKCSSFLLNEISVPVACDFLVPSDHVMEGKTPDPACPNYAFRWAVDKRSQYCDGAGVLRQTGLNGVNTVGPVDTHEIRYDEQSPLSLWTGSMEVETSEGIVFHTKDSMEIFVVLPAGTSGSILPGRHYLNLTGNEANGLDGNPLFTEWDRITPAVLSGIVISVVEQ